jgi:HD-GYP domain-containing protein (c-di-GMP phosphodiesterase class II)
MSVWEAKDVLLKGAGTSFDPTVVDAFVAALQKGQMEVPALVV